MRENVTFTSNDFKVYMNFLKDDMISQLQSRFQDIINPMKLIIPFVIDPFNHELSYEDTIEICKTFNIKSKNFRQQAIRLRSSSTLKSSIQNSFRDISYRTKNLEVFWKTIFELFEEPEDYVDLKELISKVFCIFGTTWTSESSFSTMKRLKNKDRWLLSQENLCNQLRLALNDNQIDFESVLNEIVLND